MPTDVTPQFKGWTKPATVVEALERSLAHARIEEKWIHGFWFDTDLTLDTDDFYVTPLESTQKKFAEDISEMTCTDVTACSAGIIAIETLDGEALAEYLTHDEELDEDFLLSDPITAGALEYVARGFRDVFEVKGPPPHRPLDFDGRYSSSPIQQIVTLNDDHDAIVDRKAHHAKIVQGFERGLELARKDNA